MTSLEIGHGVFETQYQAAWMEPEIGFSLHVDLKIPVPERFPVAGCDNSLFGFQVVDVPTP